MLSCLQRCLKSSVCWHILLSYLSFIALRWARSVSLSLFRNNLLFFSEITLNTTLFFIVILCFAFVAYRPFTVMICSYSIHAHMHGLQIIHWCRSRLPCNNLGNYNRFLFRNDAKTMLVWLVLNFIIEHNHYLPFKLSRPLLLVSSEFDSFSGM